jgi:hypothetical protein
MAMFIRIPGTVGRSTTTAVGTRRTKPSRIGRARKIISNEKEANRISSDRLNRDRRKRAARIARLKAALIVPVAALTDLVAVAVEAAPAIWTARLKTDRVAIFRTSASKISNAAVVVVDLVGVIVLAVAAVIALVVAASAAEAALADSAAAAGADDEN